MFNTIGKKYIAPIYQGIEYISHSCFAIPAQRVFRGVRIGTLTPLYHLLAMLFARRMLVVPSASSTIYEYHHSPSIWCLLRLAYTAMVDLLWARQSHGEPTRKMLEI
jgi:hypothetical protein